MISLISPKLTNTPAGATLITIRNRDGSVAHLYGTGQRELFYVYDLNGNNARETVKLADNTTILSQTITTDFGQVVAQAQPNANGGFIYSRSEYNAKGQLTKQYQDTGWNTAKTAATLYEYDAFGNVVKQTLALSSSPTPLNSPVTEMAYGAEALTDGIYRTVTRTRYNAAGNPLVSVQKSLVSNLSDTLESKKLTIDERNLTSTQWVEYHNGTKRKSYNTLPTSNITAEAVTVDGFTLSQTDNAGVTTTNTRSYTANGMIHSRTDGRGNTTTTVTDTAGRTLTVTDAAGNVTTTAYDSAHDLPATVTDAQGNTSCYRYDVRGRKVAEWGTGIQPVMFGY
ncbi:MAG: sugar-binding protein, partial [Akkermansiaceae bacterium]|nr:sugar-binding protein [Akkermansiaceae bacterium]